MPFFYHCGEAVPVYRECPYQILGRVAFLLARLIPKLERHQEDLWNSSRSNVYLFQGVIRDHYLHSDPPPLGHVFLRQHGDTLRALGGKTKGNDPHGRGRWDSSAEDLPSIVARNAAEIGLTFQ